MKIFTDLHHSGLAYSLHLLFEKRLGHELYFPIGTEWFDHGYWCIAEPYQNNINTIKQYLDLNHEYVPTDGTVSLNKVTDVKPTHYEVKDIAHDYTRKHITWDQFRSMDINIIIGSIPRHWEVYRQLKDIYKPKAKVIAQMGNMFYEAHDLMKSGTIKNLMASTSQFSAPSWVNSVFYHQEINKEVFTYSSPQEYPIKITSFVNCLPRSDLFSRYKIALHDCDVQAYGAGCPDGNISTIQEMAAIMKQSHWAYHVKPAGDGFGHVWFDWALIGRPIITNFSDYHDKLAGEIFEDGVTGIDLEKRSFEDNVKYIRELSQPTIHRQMCREINRRVKEKMNYKEEAKSIREFINNLH